MEYAKQCESKMAGGAIDAATYPEMQVKIVEIFKSIEGEGSRAGHICTFVRLFGCNLRCSFCDSMYANEGDQYTEMYIKDVVDKVEKIGCELVTLTGGEPLLTMGGQTLLDVLVNRGFKVNVETNGSINLPFVLPEGSFYTMDYKCSSSGMNKFMSPGRLFKLVWCSNPKQNNVLKFVVGDETDLEEMKMILSMLGSEFTGLMGLFTHLDVFVSPVFGKIEPSEIVQYLIDNDLNGVRVQLQLHKFIWDPNMRGV